jgi:hypothetical protein
MRALASFLCTLALAVAPANAADEKGFSKFELKIKPTKVDQNDGELLKLQKERYNAAVEVVEVEMLRVEAGRQTAAGMGAAINRVVEAGLDFMTEPKERLALLDESIQAAKHIEQLMKLMYDNGVVNRSELAIARHSRLSMEIRRLREMNRKK